MTADSSSLRSLDWCVLGGYLLLLGGGLALAKRRAASARDYFVGHGQVPAWAAAISVLASAMSVATWLGAPESAYHHDLTYLISNLGAMLAVVVVALVFIPAYYRARVVTVYELVGNAYGPAAQRASSATFLVARLLASSIRLYISAIPLAALLGHGLQGGTGATLLIILLLGLVGIAYTLAGGLVGIIWTDVVQFAVTMLAVAALVVVLARHIPADPGTVVSALSQAGADGHSKLRLLDCSTDLQRSNTLWTALTGYLLFNLAAYGTDQDLTQRMLACRSAWSGSASALLALVFNLPVVALMLLVGLMLYVVYLVPAVMGATLVPAPPAHAQALVTFLLTQMPAGLTGLVLAGLTASAFTSLLSAINAMASAAINDFYRPLRPGHDERHYLRASHAAVVISGLLLIAMGMLCFLWHRVTSMDLLDFAFAVVAIPYSGLLGIFLGARLSRRGSPASAIAGLITGMLVATGFQHGVWQLLTPGWPQPAWPWGMLVATAAATLVCCLGAASPRPLPRPASEAVGA